MILYTIKYEGRYYVYHENFNIICIDTPHIIFLANIKNSIKIKPNSYTSFVKEDFLQILK